MADSSERRRNARANIRWPVSVQTPHGKLEGETGNISLTGAYILCPKTPNPGEVVKLSLSPPDHAPIVIEAEVIWVSSGAPFGMGVSLGELSNADELYISEMIRRALG